MIALRESLLEFARPDFERRRYAAFSARVYAFWVNLTQDFGKRPEQGDVIQGVYIPNERR